MKKFYKSDSFSGTPLLCTRADEGIGPYRYSQFTNPPVDSLPYVTAGGRMLSTRGRWIAAPLKISA